MSEYTPTTDEVRKSAAFGAALAAVIPDEAMDINFPVPGFRVAAKSTFDLWLAVHDREVAAKALRDAAIEAQQSFVDEQNGIGPARVPTDWLRARAAALISEPSTPEQSEGENHG